MIIIAQERNLMENFTKGLSSYTSAAVALVWESYLFALDVGTVAFYIQSSILNILMALRFPATVTTTKS